MNDDGRFAPFTDAELIELWDALTMSDGLRYGFGPEDDAVAILCRELHAEATRRDLTSDAYRWDNVL